MTGVTATVWPPARARVSWILFDWAAQPWFTLITTFVYAPFFAAALAADPVRGQALWGYATGVAGLAIALMSPVLGAVADASGARKPWIAAFSLLLVVGAALLWFAKPGSPDAVFIALAAFVIGAIGVEFATLFNNAMMPTLAPPERMGSLSGTGWAVGYLGGMASLVIVLGFLAANPQTGQTLLGFAPAFGLDPAAREGDRFAGPLTAVWYLVFVAPMFLFVPDMRSRGVGLAEAARRGLAGLKATLAGLGGRPLLARFLIANMIANDGLVALFAFGGIYAAGVFGWTTIQLGMFGVLLTITGALGAWIGGRLDDRFGPKPVMLVALVLMAATCAAILSLDRDRIFFVIAVAPPAGGLFASVPERIYLGLGAMIGLMAGPIQAAARSLLVRLAPPDQIGQHFGLLALSGKMTAFAGPFLVAVATDATRTQKAGLAVLVVFFLGAAAILAPLRAGTRGG